MMIGHSPKARPYSSHSATPSVNAPYMPSEMPAKSLDRKVCRACGTNAPVVKVAAR